MVSVPKFTMGADISSNWMQGASGVSNALANWNARNMAAERAAQADRQWQASNALAQAQFAESKRQFGANYGLRQREMDESSRRFGMSHNLDKRRLALSESDERSRRENEFNTRAAGVAQMVAEQADPAVAAAQWQRLVSSDPRWKRALSTAGIDPSDYRAGTDYIIAQARGFVDRPKLGKESLKPGETVLFYDPKTGREVSRLQSPGSAALGPYATMKDKAGVEESLRKEYASLAKPYFETRDAWSRIEQSAKVPSPASDIALIFNFMKMLDPGSVVREGEFATAQNAAGVPERVQALYNRVISGERLTGSIRNDFVNQARGLYQRAEGQYKAIQRQYGDISKRVGVDPSNTIVDFGTPSAPAPNAGETKVLGGKTYIKVDGKWYEQ